MKLHNPFDVLNNTKSDLAGITLVTAMILSVTITIIVLSLLFGIVGVGVLIVVLTITRLLIAILKGK